MDDFLKEENRTVVPALPPDNRPVEPEESGFKMGWLKGLLFLIFALYLLVTAFHAPLLTALGRYLVVEHAPEKSDLIVCLSGGIVDRGLASADAFHKGLAPRVFMAREALPDGYDTLAERGIYFPTSADLLARLMTDLGVPGSALIMSEVMISNTWDEAQVVKRTVEEQGLNSMMIITSPTHTRRTWLIYSKIFDKDQVRIIILPSRYSDFSPEDWWKKRRYLREVVFEYQKLVVYFFRYFL